MNFIQSNLNNLLAIAWFALLGWLYPLCDLEGRDTACLASVLHLYREDWMRRMLLRDNRIADASVIGNLERNASFFASSTLIILAGILTVLGASDRHCRCWPTCRWFSKHPRACRRSSCCAWPWCSSMPSSRSAGACASTTLPPCWWGRRR
jgi:uncharacterized membrane protein